MGMAIIIIKTHTQLIKYVLFQKTIMPVRNEPFLPANVLRDTFQQLKRKSCSAFKSLHFGEENCWFVESERFISRRFSCVFAFVFVLLTLPRTVIDFRILVVPSLYLLNPKRQAERNIGVDPAG